MTASDDGRPNRARAGAEQANGSPPGDRALDDEGIDDLDRGSVKQNVDRVADKVKGLLRSGH